MITFVVSLVLVFSFAFAAWADVTAKQGMFVHHNNAELQDLGGGLTRRVLAWNDQLMAAEVGNEAGAAGELHRHPHTQCSYVLSGRFKYIVEGETVELGAGDSVVVPGGALHGTECIEAGTLLDIFTPARQDFLK